MADWAALPSDLILIILEKVKLVEDFVVFGSVCKSWNEAVTISKNKCFRRQIPWLLFPEGSGHGRRQIFSLTKEKILPNDLYIPEMSNKNCIGLNYGWVLTLSRTCAMMNLVHPISRRQIDLPPLPSCPERWFYHHIKRAALSANPSESSNFVVMIVHNEVSSYMSYWKPGKTRWTMVSRENHVNKYSDLTYYQDQFYAIDYHGNVSSFRFSARDNNNIPTRRLVARIQNRLDHGQMYILGSEGRLLIIARDERNILLDCRSSDGSEFNWCGEDELLRKYRNSDYSDWYVKFRVYELELKNGANKRITSLGDRALFVGDNTSISVDHASVYQNLRSNHIYFSDHAVGCYSLKENDDIALFRGCSSFWFTPSL